MPDVLVVDDDQSVRDLLRMYFEKDQFTVRTAADGSEALAAAASHRPDLVVLDIMMPGKDGYEVCRELRAQAPIPIIFLTARDDEVEPIIGLEMGADDYVTKPFNARELVARAKAVLRRSQAKAEEPPQQPLQFAQFEINPSTREVRVLGQQVALTPHEFDIVYLLATKPRQVFPRADIMSAIWGYDSDYGDYRTVDTHLKRARQKLREAGMTECNIETVWGIGYRFVPPEG
jgi:two-component system, OmpR family, response regulator ResD